jgi:hypothetical protein
MAAAWKTRGISSNGEKAIRQTQIKPLAVRESERKAIPVANQRPQWSFFLEKKLGEHVCALNFLTKCAK